ncbi:unnamed protein product [Phytomonas sp. EM1]|nr:unnamed protein product [Phytomonas sp. EM1]|eukprot:CCW59806.1 unnamed protein product [Phytomonas sp. isolate EM1]
MEFMVITSAQHVAPPIKLSSSSLIFTASRETRQRKEQVLRRNHKSKKRLRTDASSSGADMVLKISGRLLKQLCFSELQDRRYATAVGLATSLDKFHCVIAPCVESALDGVFQLIPSANLDEYLFDVHNELMSRDQLVVFTVWDNLEDLAVSEQQHHLFLHHKRERRSVAATVLSVGEGSRAESVAAPAYPPTAPPEGSSSGIPPPPSPFSRTSRLFLSMEESKEDRVEDRFSIGSNRSTPTIGPHLQRVEPFLNAVPTITTPQDIKDLNELLDDGVIRVGEGWMGFLCSRCAHIPPLTLTMPCCGGMLCPPCLPSPPTVEGVSRGERLCPICHEEPSEPPRSHPQHDERLSHLVKELKVLYLPQLRALKQTRESPSYPIRGLLLANTSPFLGSL